jgi:hypothetical protein
MSGLSPLCRRSLRRRRDLCSWLSSGTMSLDHFTDRSEDGIMAQLVE